MRESKIGRLKNEGAVIRDLAGLLVVALAVRLVWLWLGSWVSDDSADYMRIAANIVDHFSFSLGDNGVPPTAFRPPLYPAFIAGVWTFFGRSVIPVLVFQVLLGAATVCLTYLIARGKFGRITALVAAGALALAPMTGLFTVTVLAETLFTFLAVLAVYFWASGKHILAGIAFGLATLTRPIILPFLLLLLLMPLLPVYRRKWRLHMTIVLAAALVVGFWTVRNAITFQVFVPVASAGFGVNLLCGTLDTDTGGHVWNGTDWVPLDLEQNPVIRRDGITDEFELDRVRRQRATARIADDPAGWLLVRAKQYPKLFIDNGDYLLGDSNRSIKTAFVEGKWGVIIFKSLFITINLLVMALALMGFWKLRGKWAATTFIWALPLFGALIHLPMWIEPRYFLPMMPMVFILAAVGLCSAVFRSSVEVNE